MKHRGGCRPDKLQQLLLRTVLEEPGNREASWLGWESRIDLDRLDPGSLRLLPLLYVRLREAGIPDSRIARYRGIYRHYWYRNRILIHRLSGILDLLNGAGIVPLLLKGLPMALETYSDPALRPMMDLDLLVEPEQLHEATSILIRQGWQTDHLPPAQLDWIWLTAVKAVHLTSPENIAIDLHGTILSEIADEQYDRRVYTAGHMVEIQNSKARIPHPEDLLFHTIIHGHRWNPLPPFRWIVDSVEILDRYGAEIRWGNLFKDANNYHFSKRLTDGLIQLDQFTPDRQRYLPTESKDPRKHPIPVWEVIEHWMKTRESTVPARMGYVLYDTWRFMKRTPGRKHFRELLRFLKFRWNISRNRELPAEMVRRFRKLISESKGTAKP